MPVEMIGWIAPRVSSERSRRPDRRSTRGHCRDRAHSRAGRFRSRADRLLLGCARRVPGRAHAASATERLSFLLAHRPVRGAAGRRPQAGDIGPAERGRLAVHIIAAAATPSRPRTATGPTMMPLSPRGRVLSLLRRTWTERRRRPFGDSTDPGTFRKSAAGRFRTSRSTVAADRRGDPLAGPARRCLHAVGRTAEGHGAVYGARAAGGGTPCRNPAFSLSTRPIRGRARTKPGTGQEPSSTGC